jgi:NAD(P)-dependent dehydrogenase (short-subunit alcohol dehydrogenase family)
VSKNKLLEGKTALVTGGSANLGAVTAETLARQGVQVAINYLPAEATPEEVLEKLRAYGQDAQAIPGDLARPGEPTRVAREAIERLGGRVDILVNNAGPFSMTPFSEMPEEEWDRILNVNLKAAYLTTQAVVPGMRAAGWGRIVNMSAGSAYIRNHSIYGLAKAAVIHLTEALALELGPEITVNAIAPGQIAESAEDIAEFDPTFVQRAIEHTPAGRLVTRQEVADIIAWLCGPQTKMVTGHTIPIGGGWRFNRF